MDDRVAAAGKGEIGKAEHLGSGQSPATEGRLGEEAEKILPRSRRGAVEAVPEIILELTGLRQAVAAVEDMHAPADPDVGLGFGHVE